jgi:hypothetical protein
MNTKLRLGMLLGMAVSLPSAALMMAQQAGAGRPTGRPEGPCDIYAAGGAPCVAAHSSTRALYAAYNGPLYQVMRQSDGKTADVGVVKPSADDPGGYADAAAQDEFCANTYCWITTLYDQSGKGNHLIQPPRGGFSGPAMGGYNNLPVADMAPVTLMGHKVYGVFIAPGMGLRQNDAKGTAVDDQAEGQYWVINGHHYNNGCCYDYGNAETDSRDDGDGTMETTYYGNTTGWYRGTGQGPWVMTDQENNLVGCVNESPNDKFCAALPSIDWRFVTATADGEPHHWRSMGGDAQKGALQVMFDGPRIKNDRNSYDPMRKQGAILLGNGGDNSNGSQGTFYEGAMTAPNTFPSAETNQKIQANVVAARYDLPRLTVAPAAAGAAPPGLQTFNPGESAETAVTFTNTTGAAATDVRVSLAVPAGWTAVVAGTTDAAKTFARPVAAGATVTATFKVTAGPAAFNGDLVASATWAGPAGGTRTDKMPQKVRSGSPVKINEFAVNSGSPANATNAFIELYNAGAAEVDISNWTLTHHPTQQPIFSAVKVPAGTKVAPRGFYLLGLSNSGLAAPAKAGDTTLHVRSTAGMTVGDTIEIDTGSGVETRKITAIGTAAGNGTTLWQPLPDGPSITVPPGSTNVPVTGTGGFEVGQKIGLGYGATFPTVGSGEEKYEVVTVTEVGKPGTQTYLAADAKAGETTLRVRNAGNISAGDKIRLDIDSLGHGIETVTVAGVGQAAAGGGGGGGGGATVELAAPLKFDHASNMPLSVRGTGITFQPATAVAHLSNEPVSPLGTGITLDSPLAKDHPIHAVVRDAAVTAAGYQGPKAPDQWFGGPALASAGNMVLRDGAGLVVDSLNYGGLVDPWASEGYHGESGAGRGGCSVASPAPGGRGGPVGPNRSAGRATDGADTDSNCNDFLLQTATALSADAAAGATNIKVTSVADLAAGQTLYVGTGDDREAAVVATVGTPGATTVGTATEAGVTVIPVANPAGFAAGQTVTIDAGENQETVVVAAVAGGGRGRGRGGPGGPGGPGGRGNPAGGATVTVTAPLAKAHAAGVQVSGSGITLTGPLAKAHAGGAQVAGGIPTPGAPNQYVRRSR